MLVSYEKATVTFYSFWHWQRDYGKREDQCMPILFHFSFTAAKG